MNRRSLGWATLFVVCVLSSLFAYRIARRPQPQMPNEECNVEQVPSEELSEPVLTDRQRPIPVFRLSAKNPPPTAAVLKDRQEMEQRLNLVRTGPSNEPCNCYGWVFTNGEYWLNWQETERILQDNDYRTVREPRPGDLVVYRNQNQIPVHIGVVRSVSAGGDVRVESRWGEMGRFLHGVNDQDFSDFYAYYRSPRRGHTLSGISEPTGTGMLSPGQQTTTDGINSSQRTAGRTVPSE